MDIKAWRKEKRAELIVRRMDLNADARRERNQRIDSLIEQGFPLLSTMVIGFCWPHRGEYDARFVVKHFRERGAMTALPAVIAKKAPLEFRHWRPGIQMKKEVYDIPVPQASDVVVPDALVVPMISFDGQGYRLGYGGGYFDITLAAITPQPIAIGVCYDQFKVETLHPQPHDIAMDFVVTESGIYAAHEDRLALLDSAVAAKEAERLASERNLPRMQNLAHAAEGYSSPPCYAHEIASGYFGEEPKEAD
ncbi:MAG: 5-formyltetrahydrofolate cyclo-ligase [Burkholderiales bacterium]